MASPEWDSIDKTTFEFKDHYCAFLDILGFKEKASLFFSNKFNLTGRILRAMNQSKSVEIISGTADRIKTRIFSDSIILCIQIEKDSLALLLNYVAVLSAFFSYEGLFLRGGISVGKYFEDFEENINYSFFSSQALIKAYEMEKEAQYPMIVIDEQLIKEAGNLPNLIIQFESKHILNFARYIINEQGEKEADIIAELDEIIHYKNNLTKKSVIEKYEWLINYYLWFIKISHSKYNSFHLKNFERFSNLIDEKYGFKEFINTAPDFP